MRTRSEVMRERRRDREAIEMVVSTRADKRFLEFHRANPVVYFTLVRLARYAKQRGRERLGIRMLWERMRWEFYIETQDAHSDYKLNDHYTSRYVRLIEKREPDLRGLFETRMLRS